MKTSSKIIAAILLIAGTSSAVFAYGGRDHWKMSPQEKKEFVTSKISKKLNLDSQQQQNFSQLAQTVIALMAEAEAGKTEHMGEIQQLLEEPSFDQAKALEMVQQKTQLINDRAPAVIASLGGFLDSLSGEQKLELQSMIKHRHEHHRHGHED